MEDVPAAAVAAVSTVHGMHVWQLGGHLPQRGLHPSKVGLLLMQFIGR
jgi:hypothetical protein